MSVFYILNLLLSGVQATYRCYYIILFYYNMSITMRLTKYISIVLLLLLCYSHKNNGTEEMINTIEHFKELLNRPDLEYCSEVDEALEDLPINWNPLNKVDIKSHQASEIT